MQERKNDLIKPNKVSDKVSNFEAEDQRYRKAAEEGDVNSQYQLAWLYHERIRKTHSSHKIIKYETEALFWYKKAAEQGHKDSMYNIGRLLITVLTKKSEDEAYQWYFKAAKLGHAQAQNATALGFLCGKYGPRDEEKAFYWYHKAAEQGMGDAQYNLACCYFSGKVVKKDIQEGVKWLRKAFENFMQQNDIFFIESIVDLIKRNPEIQASESELLKRANAVLDLNRDACEKYALHFFPTVKDEKVDVIPPTSRTLPTPS